MGNRRNWERARKQRAGRPSGGEPTAAPEEKPPLALSVERAARIERNVRRRLGKG